MSFEGELKSGAGLVFKWAKNGTEHRLAYVLEHAADNLAKNYHGVFTDGDKIIETLDEAWEIANDASKSNLVAKQIGGNGNTTYIVDMQRVVGWEGGSKGTGQDLTKIMIVIKQGTENEVVTAFPIK